MIWRDGRCQIADAVSAEVFKPDEAWSASIIADNWCIWKSYPHDSEAAAKAAVCHWIGKTMAQLSNALAAGEPRIDEE